MENEETPEDDAGEPSAIRVRRLETGGFAVETQGVSLAFTREKGEDLDQLLDVLMALRRDLTGEDFAPEKPFVPASDPTASIVFLPEHLDLLRERVRVGKEESLESAVQRAVRDYLFPPPGHERPHPRSVRGQSTLSATGAPMRATPVRGEKSAWDLGPVQLSLLGKAVDRGRLTLTDVGRAYGFHPRKGAAHGTRAKVDSMMGKLVDRGLLRFEIQGADRVWIPTAIGEALVEETRRNKGAEDSA